MRLSKTRSTALLLNAAHALDHMFLLVFATSVGAIAADFGLLRWEDLMPYGTGAFVLFGLGSLPAGRLGDHWGRRRMMLVFFFGMGASMLLIALTQGPWQLALALTLMGAFSSIYHPVGIPMLVRGAKRPGFTIGVNGLSGNLGVALSAAVTGLLVQFAGWRMAFVVPAFVAIACGFAFARVAPEEPVAPAKRGATQRELPRSLLARVFALLTVASVTAGLVFHFMTAVFGAIPFTDAMIVRYVDDRIRSRVAGLRLAVAFGVSSLAVWLLGPIVKAAGFATLLLSMAGIAALTLVAITWLPSHARTAAAMMPITPE